MAGFEYKHLMDTWIEDLGEDKVVYPPVVIAHITNEPLDLVKLHLNGKKRVKIYYSSQPNGPPHLGTMTSLGLGFALGQRIKEGLDLDVGLTFEALDNAPCNKKEIDGETYYTCLKDFMIGARSAGESNLDFFKEIMDFFKKKSGIDYEISRYSEIQTQNIFRKSLIDILRNSEIGSCLDPLEGKVKIRFPCPECRYAKKSGDSTTMEWVESERRFNLEAYCPSHGTYTEVLKEDNKDFIDLSTPVRSAIRKIRLIDWSKREKGLAVMVDGADWMGMANHLAYVLSRMGHNYSDMPLRFFSPLIEDWSGGKFSKSAYVSGNVYKNVPRAFLDYTAFCQECGSDGLDRLWAEVSSWARSSKRLFRNYSISYFEKKWIKK